MTLWQDIFFQEHKMGSRKILVDWAARTAESVHKLTCNDYNNK